MPAYRYLILQIPITDFGQFCELEVYIRRKFLDMHNVFNSLVTIEVGWYSSVEERRSLTDGLSLACT